MWAEKFHVPAGFTIYLQSLSLAQNASSGASRPNSARSRSLVSLSKRREIGRNRKSCMNSRRCARRGLKKNLRPPVVRAHLKGLPCPGENLNLVVHLQSSSLAEPPGHLAALTSPQLCMPDTRPRTRRAHRGTPELQVGTNFIDAPLGGFYG